MNFTGLDPVLSGRWYRRSLALTERGTMKRLLLGVMAAAMLTVPFAAPAGAANGDQLLVGGDFSAPTTLGALNVAGASTDFSLTSVYGVGSGAGDGSMYDPGKYVVGGNPHDFHPYWVDEPGADPQLILNGFTTGGNQKVISVTVNPAVCQYGSNISFNFSAAAHNILPLSAASDGGANISVTINGTLLGSADLTSNDPSNVVNIGGSVPWAPSLEVTLWNNGTAYSGNDFAIDDMTLTQVGDCSPPPCVDEVKATWFNYTGNFAKTGKDVNHDGIPDLDDPNWHAVPATPDGQHDVTVRGFDKPYQPGNSNPKGNGSWFVWRDLGTKCPRA